MLLYTYWENPIKYLFFFFIVKEVLMLLGGAFLLSKGMRPTAAEIWGKVATNVFYIAMIIILAFGENGALCDVTHFTLPSVVTWVLVALSAVSALVSLGLCAGIFEAAEREQGTKHCQISNIHQEIDL